MRYPHASNPFESGASFVFVVFVFPLSLSLAHERRNLKKKNRKIERRVTRETGRILASNGSGSGVGCFFELNGGALGSVVERIEFQGGRFAPPAENGTKWQKFVSRAR